MLCELCTTLQALRTSSICTSSSTLFFCTLCISLHLQSIIQPLTPPSMHSPHLSFSFKVFLTLPSPSLSLEHLCNLRIHLCTSFWRTTLFLMIAIDPHGHLTHTYLLLLVLSLSASHRPRVPVTAPLSYHHDSHCQTFDNVTTHRIAYADLARRTQLVREE